MIQTRPDRVVLWTITVLETGLYASENWEIFNLARDTMTVSVYVINWVSSMQTQKI